MADRTFNLPLSQEELESWSAAARAARLPLSQFLRRTINAAIAAPAPAAQAKNPSRLDIDILYDNQKIVFHQA